MSRIDYLTIGLVALCMFALIYLVYRYVNLGSQAAKPPVAVTEPPLPGPSTAVDTTATVSATKPIDSTKISIEKPSSTPQPNATPSAQADDKTKATTSDKTGKTDVPAANTAPSPAPAPPAPKPEPKPEPKPAPPPPPAPNSAAAAQAAAPAGKYMVIAGSYKEMRFAKEMLAKIRKMGYRKARIEKFNRGTYATVLVDRFYSEKPARKMVADLKFNAVDAMMLVKK
jgi:cell division protein FtsN